MKFNNYLSDLQVLGDIELAQSMQKEKDKAAKESVSAQYE